LAGRAVERWYKSLKKRIRLDGHFLTGDLDARIKAFVAHYNYKRHIIRRPLGA
jgi:hypothetical protein